MTAVVLFSRKSKSEFNRVFLLNNNILCSDI